MKNIITKTIFLLAFWSATQVVSAQDVLDTIFVNNPSFESNSGYTNGWTDCGFPGESPFDPQPGSFKCETVPAKGNGFIGMVARDIETYEAIAQRLTKQLERGKCYAFSLKLAKSINYISNSKSTGQKANYTTPIKIRIWGGVRQCQRNEMLAESDLITNVEWKTYSFKLKPLRDYQYIVIEAFYKTPTLFPYNGNVLVDDASNIFEIKCSDEPEAIFAALEKKKEQPKKVVKPPKKPIKKPRKEIVVVKQPVKKTKTEKTIMPELNKAVLKGQILRIPNLVFEANSPKLPNDCKPIIKELYLFLVENPTIKIELGGHSNNRCDTQYCNSLSEKRAKSVAIALIEHGITPKRVTYKGYGKEKPIATNSTAAGRKKNQRVEVKILSN